MIAFGKKIKVYTSIDDLPIYNWFKIYETDNLSFLLIEPVKNVQKYDTSLRATWNKIYCEFIDVFGISDSYRKILELKRDIVVYETLIILEGDDSYKTFLEIAKYELDKLTNDVPNKNIDNMKVDIEKYMGFRIDVKNVTVKEYYSYIKNLTTKK